MVVRKTKVSLKSRLVDIDIDNHNYNYDDDLRQMTMMKMTMTDDKHVGVVPSARSTELKEPITVVPVEVNYVLERKFD